MTPNRRVTWQAVRLGCGRWPSAITRTARRRTATSRRGRPRWRRSPRGGGGSGRDENARVEAVIPNKSLAESNKSDGPVLTNSPASGATERALPTELGAPAVISGRQDHGQ